MAAIMPLKFGIEEYNDYIVLSAYFSKGITHIDIPANINDKPVTRIGDGCFFDCTDIEEITFPQTVTTIGAQAFALCKNLRELVFPGSIIEIEPYAFRDCHRLKKGMSKKSFTHVITLTASSTLPMRKTSR